MKTINKVLRIGTISRNGYGAKRRSDVFLKATIEDGKFSISGVIGPKTNGNADGGGGQISMEFEHRNPADNDERYSHLIKPDEIQFAPGWDREKWLDLLDVWERWHLNDMNPACEHQTGPEWDTKRKLTLYYFRLSPEVEATIKAAKERAVSCLKTGETFSPLPEETRLATLPDCLTWHEATPPSADYVPNGPQYDKDTYNKASEIKTAGWVHPEEHPGGLLCKPCPVCGYKYGSEWRKRALPDSVVAFIQALPSTDKTPAWV